MVIENETIVVNQSSVGITACAHTVKSCDLTHPAGAGCYVYWAVQGRSGGALGPTSEASRLGSRLDRQPSLPEPGVRWE